MSMFIKHCKRQIIYNTSYQGRKTAGMLIMQLRASVVLEQVEVHPSLLHLFRRDGSAFSRTCAPSSIRLSALHLRSSLTPHTSTTDTNHCTFSHNLPNY